MKNSKLDLQQLKAKELTKSQMKQIMGGNEDGGGNCNQDTCHAKSNSNLGDCNCNKHGLCLCVKVWQ